MREHHDVGELNLKSTPHSLAGTPSSFGSSKFSNTLTKSADETSKMVELQEKENEAGTTSPTGTAESDITHQASKEFAPINGPSQTRSRSNSLARAPTSMRSVSRTRSNNGYGCGPDDSEESSGDVEQGAQTEKDPYEVRWDGGDNDPMNPRSMAFARKWVVVIIVSASSLCV